MFYFILKKYSLKYKMDNWPERTLNSIILNESPYVTINVTYTLNNNHTNDGSIVT